MEVKTQLSKIGQELEIMMNKVRFGSFELSLNFCKRLVQQVARMEYLYSLTTLIQGTIDDAEQFLEQHSKLLHPNHYHMTTCKHNLMQVSRHLWKVLIL